MKKRLRKKKHCGEYTEWGRQLVIMRNRKDGFDEFLDTLYGEYEITVEIDSGVINGRFPKRALRFVLEWLELYQNELLENWRLVEEKKPLNKIAPLE